jgi:hypothetical protein
LQLQVQEIDFRPPARIATSCSEKSMRRGTTLRNQPSLLPASHRCKQRPLYRHCRSESQIGCANACATLQCSSVSRLRRIHCSLLDMLWCPTVLRSALWPLWPLWPCRFESHRAVVAPRLTDRSCAVGTAGLGRLQGCPFLLSEETFWAPVVTVHSTAQ